ncbi:MAG: hypothetical protein FH751_06250 [Firmicutes bacterium]|nr:hypothetical protein [Bacillota bacterium]
MINITYIYLCNYKLIFKEIFYSIEFSLRNLEKDLLECASLNNILNQSEDQLNKKTIKKNFKDNIIITPILLRRNLFKGYSLISKTNLSKDKLNKQVANTKFSLHSNSVSNDICDGYFITDDRFKAENTTLIEEGILKNFLLSLYGSKKINMKFFNIKDISKERINFYSAIFPWICSYGLNITGN